MLVDTDNLVSVETFRKDLEKYVKAAQKGSGPVAVTKNSEVVGFFIGADEYEAMVGSAVRELLVSRSRGRKVSHANVRAHINALLP